MKLELEFFKCEDCPYSVEKTDHTFKVFSCHHKDFQAFNIHIGVGDSIPYWCPIRNEELNIK